MTSEALAWDVLSALEELARQHGGTSAREWSTVAEVAEQLSVGTVAAQIALERAAEAGEAEEHADWLGCFRLTELGRLAIEHELFGTE